MMKKSDRKTRKAYLKSYVTEDEKNHIRQIAEQANLSLSEYTRRVLTGQKITSKIDQRSFLAALKVNADLARLGGLFKLYITHEIDKVSPAEVRKVLFEIEKRQKELEPIISSIRQQIK